MGHSPAPGTMSAQPRGARGRLLIHLTLEPHGPKGLDSQSFRNSTNLLQDAIYPGPSENSKVTQEVSC